MIPDHEKSEYIDTLAALDPVAFLTRLEQAVADLGWSKTTITGCVRDIQRKARKAEREQKTAAHRKPGGGATLSIGSDSEIADRVRDDMLNDSEAMYLFTEGSFYRWSGKTWTEVPLYKIQDRFVTSKYDGAHYGDSSRVRFNESRVKSVSQFLTHRMEIVDYFDDRPAGVNVDNGFVLFDKDGTPSLVPHDPEQRARHVSPGSFTVDYKLPPDSRLAQFFVVMLRDDPEADLKTRTLQEIAGAALLGHSMALPQPKAAILIGRDANNGKSEYLKLLEGLVGKDACSHVAAHEFDEKNLAITLRGKLLNTTSELASAHAVAGELFKKVVTHEEIHGKLLYKDMVMVRPQAQHVFACNRLPPFVGGLDKGCRRRLLVLEFHRAIPKDEMVPLIAQQIINEEFDLLLNFAMAGASRLIRQQGFTVPPSSIVALDQWVRDVDAVASWQRDRVQERDTHQTYTPKQAYDLFYTWAEENHIKANYITGKPEFENRMADRYPGCKRSNDTRRWSGITILTTDANDLADDLRENQSTQQDEVMWSIMAAAAEGVRPEGAADDPLSSIH